MGYPQIKKTVNRIKKLFLRRGRTGRVIRWNMHKIKKDERKEAISRMRNNVPVKVLIFRVKVTKILRKNG